MLPLGMVLLLFEMGRSPPKEGNHSGCSRRFLEKYCGARRPPSRVAVAGASRRPATPSDATIEITNARGEARAATTAAAAPPSPPLLPRDAWTRAGPCNTWLAGGCDTWLTLHCVTGFIFLYSQRWKYLLLLGFLSLSLALSGAMTISLSFLWGTAVGIPVGVVVGTYTQKWMVGVAVYARAPALPSLE